MSHASLLEATAPLLIAVGLLCGAIIRIFVSMRQERARLTSEEG